MSLPVRAVVVGVAVASLGLLGVQPAIGQGVRGWTTTSMQYAGLRPVVADTVSPDRLDPVSGEGGAATFGGRPAFCTPALTCTYYRPEPRAHAATAQQDLAFTAWGFGVENLSATVLLRGRARLGGAFVWPRSDDDFDAILAYLEYGHGDLRFRLGRQETLSGLGFRGYDGASARWAATRESWVEVFGGRSLARGLSEPADRAFAGFESFALDRGARLFGGAGSWGRPGLGTGTVRYQRELYSGGAAVISERASLSVRSEAFQRLSIDAAVDYDLAFGRVGKAHLTGGFRFPGSGLLLDATVRRYVPYFDLSTIWGLFSPVAYHEVALRGTWSGARGHSVQAEVGRRHYEPTETAVVFSALEDDGWRARAEGTMPVADRGTLRGAYRLDWGIGAFLSSADASFGWRLREGFEVTVNGSAFQQFQEFRVGEGRVLGGGMGLAWDLGPGRRLSGGVASYHLTGDGRSVPEPWDHLRAWTSLTISFGSDPGSDRPRLRR